MAADGKSGEEAKTDAPGLQPFVSDAQMRKLRVAVIGMGLVLLAGFAVVIGRIVYLLNRTPVDPAQLAASTGATATGDVRVALPPGAVVRHLSLSGNRLAVHYDAPGGAAIAIVDLVAGRAVQRIELAPAAGR